MSDDPYTVDYDEFRLDFQRQFYARQALPRRRTFEERWREARALLVGHYEPASPRRASRPVRQYDSTAASRRMALITGITN
jgi:hypothetical protein